MNRKKPPLELPKGVEPEHEGHWAGWIKPDGSTSSVTAAHHNYLTGTPAHHYVLDHLGFDEYHHARKAGHARFLMGQGWGGPFLDVQYDGDQHHAAQNVADFVSAHHEHGMKLNVLRYADEGSSYSESHDKGDVLRWIKEKHPNVTIKEDFDDIPKVGLHTPKGEKPHFDHHWAGWIQPDGSTYSMTDRAHGYEAGMEAHSPLSDEMGFTSGYRGPLGFGFTRFVHGRNLNGTHFLSLGYDPAHPAASKNVADFLDAHHKKGMEITITHMHSRKPGLYGEDHYGHSKAAAKKWVKKHAPKQVAESEFMHTPFFKAMSHDARQKVRDVHARKVLNPKGAWLGHGVEPDHDGEWGGFISPNGATYSATDRRSKYYGGNAIHADLSYELGAPPHNRNGDYTLLHNHGWVRFTRSNTSWGSKEPNFVFNYAKQHHEAAHKLVSDFLDKHHKPGVQINISRDHEYSPYEGYDKEEAKEWLKSRPANPVSESGDQEPKGAWMPRGEAPQHDGNWAGWIHPDGRTYSSTDRLSGYSAGNAIHADLSGELGHPRYSGSNYGAGKAGMVRFVHGQRSYTDDSPYFAFDFHGEHADTAKKTISDFLDVHHKPGVKIHILNHSNWQGALEDATTKEQAKVWLNKQKQQVVSEAVRNQPSGVHRPAGVALEHERSWGGWIKPDGSTYGASDLSHDYRAGDELHRYLTKDLGFDGDDDYEPMHHGHVRFAHGPNNWDDGHPYFGFTYRREHAEKAHKLISDFLDAHYKKGSRVSVNSRPTRDASDSIDVRGEHADPVGKVKEWMKNKTTSEGLIRRALNGESPRAIVEAIWPTLRSQMTSMKGKKVRPGVTLSQKKQTPFGFKAPTVITKRPTDVSQQPSHRRYRGQELEMQDNAGEISANVYGVHDLADLEIQRQQKGARPIVMRGE